MVRIKEKIHLLTPGESPTKIGTLDGVRLEFPDSWVLNRASGTEPVIRVISESTSQTQTSELISKGKELVQNTVEGNR